MAAIRAKVIARCIINVLPGLGAAYALMASAVLGASLACARLRVALKRRGRFFPGGKLDKRQLSKH